jgi:hypothetical protein
MFFVDGAHSATHKEKKKNRFNQTHPSNHPPNVLIFHPLLVITQKLAATTRAHKRHWACFFLVSLALYLFSFPFSAVYMLVALRVIYWMATIHHHESLKKNKKKNWYIVCRYSRARRRRANQPKSFSVYIQLSTGGYSRRLPVLFLLLLLS